MRTDVIKMATLRSSSREGDGPAPLEHHARCTLLHRRFLLLLLGQKGSDFRVLGVARTGGLVGHRGRSERQRRRDDVVGSERRGTRRGRGVALAGEGEGGGDELAELLLEAEGADPAAARGVERVEVAVHAVDAHVRLSNSCDCFEILHLRLLCLSQALQQRIWVARSFFLCGLFRVSLLLRCSSLLDVRERERRRQGDGNKICQGCEEREREGGDY